MDELNLKIEEFIDDCLKGKDLEMFLKRKDENQDVSRETDLRIAINKSLKDKGFIELKEILDKQKTEFLVRENSGLFHQFTQKVIKRIPSTDRRRFINRLNTFILTRETGQLKTNLLIPRCTDIR